MSVDRLDGGKRDADSSLSISIVIVTYNSAGVIAAALSAVARYLPDAEIVVVDNGSTDGTDEIVVAHRRVRLVRGHGNVGFGAGVNLGVRAATGELILVHNPDAFPTSVDLAKLDALAARTPLGLCGCQLRENGRLQRTLQLRRGWRGELCWSLVNWYLVPRELKSFGSRPRHNSGTWISGAAFIVNRGEFLDVGGFDERLFLYYEDFELSRAYSARGLPIEATDAVVLDHIGHASSAFDNDQTSVWALMSLIEQTAKWEGPASARAAARWTWELLGAIESIGNAVRRLPLVGGRGGRKAESAACVRQGLWDESNNTGDPFYPAARAALAPVIHARAS
jgi:GT2 family glycosyltransferase